MVTEAPSGPRSPRTVAAGLVLLVLAIGWLDSWTGAELSISIFFLIPVALAAWQLGRAASFALSFLSAAAWLVAELVEGRHYAHVTIPYWNAAVHLGFFLIVAAVLDARRRAERRIVELLDVKSEFVSLVSHELRTPLTCIKEGIDIVQDGTCGPLQERQREPLLTAKRNVDRLARLLDNVLDFQKLEAGRLDLVREDCDLNRLVRQGLETFELAARRSGVELVASLGADLPPVACDPDRVSQVLGNLLSNGLRFARRGPLRVSTRFVAGGDPAGDPGAPRGPATTPPRAPLAGMEEPSRPGGTGEVRVLVEDDGPGIPPAELPLLFRAFTQLSTARQAGTQAAGGGTGLGLALSRGMIESMGGRLGVESRPGQGSTFWFALPVQRPPSPAPVG